MSCARLLAKKGERFLVVDTRQQPVNLASFEQLYPQIKVVLGPLNKTLLASASELIVSPGIAKDDPAIAYVCGQRQCVNWRYRFVLPGNKRPYYCDYRL